MTPRKSPRSAAAAAEAAADTDTDATVRRTPVLASLAAAVLATGLLAVAAVTGVPWADSAITAAHGSTPAVPAPPGHWQGTAVPVKKGDITAVAALGDKQAWAVGYRLKSNTKAEAVALRWNGTAWKQESTLPDGSFPQGLSVRSAKDIWVVGTSSQHWDGKSWTTHKLDDGPGGRVVPDAVATTSDGKAWAVGRAVPRSIKDGTPSIQAWNGDSWQRQTLPDVGKGELNSVTALAPDDVWAVGTAYAADSGKHQTSLVLHWNGHSWKRIDSPNAQGADTLLGGVTALAPDDLWAVGASTSGSSERPYAVHWNGTKWTTARTPAIADGRLRAVGRDGKGGLWAVGGKGAVSVALHWNGKDARWERAADPGVVVRSFATVPHSAALWTAGIGKRGDLVPAITRLKG